MKPLVCPHCNTPAPERIEPTGIQMGGYVAFICTGCRRTLHIPWGRCSNELIERAREATKEK